MSSFASLKKHWYWAGVLALGAAVAAVALAAPAKISRIELEREASLAAARLNALMLQEPETLSQAIGAPSGAQAFAGILAKAGYGDRALRYALYDHNGRLVYTGGVGALPLEKDLGAALATPAPEDAKVTLYERSDAAPTNFAALALPLAPGGDPRGTLVVYLDQTDQAKVLAGYFGWVTTGLLLLLGAGIAVLAVLGWMRGRESRQTKAQLRYLEQHDALTRLANRQAFSDSLNKAVARLHRDCASIAVLCLDIDNFNKINHAVDHSGGDQVLRDLGARIQAALREGDLVGRSGGDEFAVALVDIANLSEVMSFMNRLVEMLRRPLVVAGKELIVTVSAGAALAPADGEDAATLLRHAAIALTRAKRDGGQRMCFYEESMNKALQRRRMVEHELRLALGRGEFEVVYQPQFDLATERQCGSEALIRWHHPVHGKIAPAHFIAVAEDTGLIVPLGEWVLRRACNDAVKWPEPLFVSVNLSPAQFREGDVAALVAGVLEETGLAPQRLELEITENLLINDTEEVLATLDRLRHLGVNIAMDDFGTGYSSLSFLARFPFSKIKIDRQFVRNMTRDPAMRAIVKTVIALGKSLDVVITAEGVETEEQADMLREFGCPQVQGFLYGYPGPVDTSLMELSGNVTPIGVGRHTA
ncbi:MAG TPA: bifunctional diguanylate cyclase/phosphodiesterase [Methyloceanibacter sp.]|nr:bifunctional diguanylate cyclase/phosphodiesterase [Methyloceanibacter sp.]